MTPAMKDAIIWQCLSEAEQRHANSNLPIEARVRAAHTFSVFLKVAHSRGYSYYSLRKVAQTNRKGARA